MQERARIVRIGAWTAAIQLLVAGMAYGATAEEDYKLGRERYAARDYAGAAKAWQAAADAGEARSMHNLGLLYDAGAGVRRDEAKAVQLYRQAAEAGVPQAMLYYGEALRMGRQVEKDVVSALVWVRKSAEAGYVPAMRQYGNYICWRLVQVDHSEADKWWKKATDAGDAEAPVLLGEHQRIADITWLDGKEAARLFRIGAERGSRSGMRKLGQLYATGGGGLAADRKEALTWLDKAAEAGDEVALFEAAELRRSGSQAEQALAAEVYRKLAAQGHVRAMGRWGVALRLGRGVEKNTTEALKWLQKAADRMDPEALHHLGIMYTRGEGVAKDPRTGFKYHAFAAQQGHTSAMFYVGQMWHRGEGLPANPAYAKTWLIDAAKKGDMAAQLVLAAWKEDWKNAKSATKMLPQWVLDAEAEAKKEARRLNAADHKASEATPTASEQSAAPRGSSNKVADVRPVNAAAAAAALPVAEELVKAGNLRLSGDFLSRVSDGDGTWREAFEKSDGQTLVDLARHKRIFVFVHGFEQTEWGGKPRAQAVLETWQEHLDLIARQRQPAAAVMVRHNTLDGFGDHQPQLGNFLFALRWLTDSAALYDPQRTIIVVCHSAGGNYAKNAYLLMRQHFEVSGMSAGGAADTGMRFVFLATPHEGTDLDRAAQAGTAFYRMFVEQLNKGRVDSAVDHERWKREVTADRYDDMVRSRGVAQLRRGSPELRKLNAAFLKGVKEAGNVEVLSIAGGKDAVVPVDSAVLEGAGSLKFAELGHSSFLYPQRLTPLQPAFLGAYGYAEHVETEKQLRATRGEQALTGAKSGAVPRFRVTQAERTKRAVAIENYLHSRSLLELPAGTFTALADEIDVKLTAARIPQKYLGGVDDKGWHFEFNGKPAYALYLISEYRHHDGVDGPLRQRLDRLKQEISSCFDPLLGSVTFPWMTKQPDPTSPYSPQFPEGFAKRFEKPRFSGPGALAREDIVSFLEVIRDMSSQYAHKHKLPPMSQPLYVQWAKLLPKEVLGAKILRCMYVPEDGSSRVRTVRYFWYKEEPGAFAEAKSKLPEGTPMRTDIGPAREAAPERLSEAKW